MSGVQQLKLDVTTLSLENNTVPVVLNFNIPVSVVEENIPQPFDEVLNNIAECIKNNFDGGAEVLFQVTASYYLVHVETEDRRLWTGSFYPGGNHSASLSGVIFQAFNNSPSFVQRIKEFSLPQNIAAYLKWGGEESKWTFDSLASIITSVQVQLPPDHEFLRANDLLINRARHQRRHITKFYPF